MYVIIDYNYPYLVVTTCMRDWYLVGLWLTCCVAVISSVVRTIRYMCKSTTTNVDPMLLPSGNPIKCHEEVLCFSL